MQHGTSNSMSSFSTCDITSGPVGFSAAGRKDSETDAALSWALSSLPQGAVRRGRVAPCGAGGWLPSRTWKSSGTSLKSPPHPAGLSSQAGRSAHGSSNTDCRFNRQVTKPCSAAGNRRDNRSPRLWSKNGRVQRGTLAEVTTPGGPHEERAPGCSWPRQEADSPSLLVQSTGAQGDLRGAQRGSGLCGEGANRAAQHKACITFRPLGPGFWEGTSCLGFFVLENSLLRKWRGSHRSS